jgi:hypothetical protein
VESRLVRDGDDVGPPVSTGNSGNKRPKVHVLSYPGGFGEPEQLPVLGERRKANFAMKHRQIQVSLQRLEMKLHVLAQVARRRGDVAADLALAAVLTDVYREYPPAVVTMLAVCAIVPIHFFVDDGEHLAVASESVVKHSLCAHNGWKILVGRKRSVRFVDGFEAGSNENDGKMMTNSGLCDNRSLWYGSHAMKMMNFIAFPVRRPNVDVRAVDVRGTVQALNEVEDSIAAV